GCPVTARLQLFSRFKAVVWHIQNDVAFFWGGGRTPSPPLPPTTSLSPPPARISPPAPPILNIKKIIKIRRSYSSDDHAIDDQ
ncbi:hypothetical protein V2J09_017154, partial [Rumex salicifolius]